MNMVNISIDEVDVNVLLPCILANVFENLQADFVLEEGLAILC